MIIFPVSISPILEIVSANRFKDTAIRINPAPLNTPIFAFLVKARKAASSRNTAPSPATPLIIFPVSISPILEIVSANRFKDTAIRINPAPLNTPIFAFLVKARKAASSRNTAPSPATPLIIFPVSISPILEIVSANNFKDTAIRINPAPLNTPIFAFLVKARKAASSRNTAPSPATPLIIFPVSISPILEIVSANNFKDTAIRINPAPLNTPIFAFLVKARKAASSRNTAPSPETPLIIFPVSISPI